MIYNAMKKNRLPRKRNHHFLIFCIFLCLLIVIVYSVGDREKETDTTSPTIYEKGGIRFSYPGNWKITEDMEDEDNQNIFIESPGNAVFIIQIYLSQDSVPLPQFAEQFSNIANQETSSSMISNYSFSDLEELTTQGNRYGIQENFSIKVLGNQLSHIRRYYSVTNNNRVAYLISQATTESLTKVETGFSLILETFSFSPN